MKCQPQIHKSKCLPRETSKPRSVIKTGHFALLPICDKGKESNNKMHSQIQTLLLQVLLRYAITLHNTTRSKIGIGIIKTEDGRKISLNSHAACKPQGDD